MKQLLSFVSAFVFVLAACDKQAGQTPGISPGSSPATRVPHWLELPETSQDDGLDFFSHNGSLNGKPVRNWSFYVTAGTRLSERTVIVPSPFLSTTIRNRTSGTARI